MVSSGHHWPESSLLKVTTTKVASLQKLSLYCLFYNVNTAHDIICQKPGYMRKKKFRKFCFPFCWTQNIFVLKYTENNNKDCGYLRCIFKSEKGQWKAERFSCKIILPEILQIDKLKVDLSLACCSMQKKRGTWKNKDKEARAHELEDTEQSYSHHSSKTHKRPRAKRRRLTDSPTL